jgi:cold shock CspA family protein/GTPase SAR1 family protein
MQAVLDDFSVFYELLSKEHSAMGTYRVIFDSIHENRLVLDRELSAPLSASDNRIVQKSGLSFDLENVFDGFFAGLAGDQDPEMLVECFVETRESRIADFSLERLTKNVLGNIDPSERDVGQGLEAIVQGAVAGELGQTVFIVGPSGAGKSTFLERFFSRTLAPETRARCVVVKIDALDASGDESTALHWVTERAISSIERALFDDGIPAWNDLQGLYQLEYVRRSKGVDSALYNRDKAAFKEKFAGYVEEQVERDREGYLRRLLTNVVKSRKKLPIFFVDNTDEFSLTFKTSLFQYFQAMRREIKHCLLIFPATDRSAWSFSKTDIFNIYSSKSFFLPTPSPREVFRKRIEYIRRKANSDDQDSDSAGVRDYVTARGIRVSIRNLQAFASVIESVFVNQDYAAKRVGELANYNMRKALGLAKRVITSSVLNLEDLVRSYVTGDMAAPSPVHFSNALIKGDYQHFKPGDEPLLFPVFQVDSTVRQSPLIHARILTLLSDLTRGATEDAERYMSVNSILAYFGVMSVAEAATQRGLEALLLSGLLEPYDLSKKDYSDDQRLAITFSGLAHLDLSIYNPVFFEQFALTTRLPDPEAAEEIRDAYLANGSLIARLERVRELFAAYLCDEDERHLKVPQREEFRSQAALCTEIRGRWSTAKATSEEHWQLPDVVAEAVAGIVESFDRFRGYGFVDVPSLRDSAFLHARILEQGNLPEVHDGDRIVCDVNRNEKGLVVSRVLSVEPDKSTKTLGRIVKLFPDRGYGFINVPELGTDAFFHYHLFKPDERDGLTEGTELVVELRTDERGRAQVRRIV